MRPYTIKQLLTFIEVAKQESVSKAAQKLFVTQPAVSMQLRQLEDAFGVPLVETVGRNIKLTHSGEEFLTHAISAIGELKNLEASMSEHAELKRGHLDLAVVSTAKYFVPMLLVHFRKLHPEITISLFIDNREKILAMLSRNEVDLVIMGRVPDDLDCDTIAFATNPLAIVAPPNHPLVGQKNIKASALKDYSFVVREIGSGTRATMERFMARADVPINIVMEMPSNETIKQATMAGMGLSFLSLRTVRHELASGHLQQLEIEGLPIIGNWHATRLQHRKASPAAKAFKDFLVSDGSKLIDAWA